MRKPISVWIRCETREDEKRAPLCPAGALLLLRAGINVTVERSAQRSFAINEYANVGCAITEAGSWMWAPRDTLIVGLKELPEQPPRLVHRHIFFGHAFKGQAGAKQLLRRFAEGDGILLDLEHLTDLEGRRLVAFGRWAGYVGAALALFQWKRQLARPLAPMSKEAFDEELIALRPAVTGVSAPRILVLGALGRCGQGVCEALALAAVEPTCWDVNETKNLDHQALLDHDILINAVLMLKNAQSFMVRRDVVDMTRRLSVIVDVTCDVASHCNALPIYDALTSWRRPVCRLSDGARPLDIIAIDNLPSLLPRESSLDFSAALAPHLLMLTDFEAPWQRCAKAFLDARDLALIGAEASHV